MDEKDFYSLLRHDGRNKAQIVQGYLQLLEDEVSCEGVEYVNEAEEITDELAEKMGDVGKGKDSGEFNENEFEEKAQTAKEYIQFLEDDEDLSDDAKEFVEKTYKALDDGMELIENVGTAIRVGEEPIEPVELDPIIEDSLETYCGELETEYESYGGEVMAGECISEVFDNLFGNIRKHSGADKVKVDAKDEDGNVLVRVEDDGRGIPDEYKERIFDQGFKKGENAGSGLGTYPMKEIVETYKGEIEVKDSDYGGARFDIRLKKA